MPDRFAPSYGLSKQLLQVATPASATEAPAALQVWNKLALGSRDLTLVDVSSAMAKPASPSDPTGPTLEQELTQTASLGLALFADTANLGLWEFADHIQGGALPYKQLVSVGPLPQNLGVISRRAQLERINGSLAADRRPACRAVRLDPRRLQVHAGDLQAEVLQHRGRARVRRWRTRQATSPPGELLKKLAKLSDPARRVAVIIIAFSPSADFTELKKIANFTGGQAYQISDPSQVLKVFYQALAHRLCDHGCVAP